MLSAAIELTFNSSGEKRLKNSMYFMGVYSAIFTSLLSLSRMFHSVALPPRYDSGRKQDGSGAEGPNSIAR